jgi:hypothetical protein
MVLHGLVSRLIAKEFSFLVLWKKKEKGRWRFAWCGTALLRRALCGGEGGPGQSSYPSFFTLTFCLAAIILASCVYSVFIFPITLVGYEKVTRLL